MVPGRNRSNRWYGGIELTLLWRKNGGKKLMSTFKRRLGVVQCRYLKNGCWTISTFGLSSFKHDVVMLASLNHDVVKLVSFKHDVVQQVSFKHDVVQQMSLNQTFSNWWCFHSREESCSFHEESYTWRRFWRVVFCRVRSIDCVISIILVFSFQLTSFPSSSGLERTTSKTWKGTKLLLVHTEARSTEHSLTSVRGSITMYGWPPVWPVWIQPNK